MKKYGPGIELRLERIAAKRKGIKISSKMLEIAKKKIQKNVISDMKETIQREFADIPAEYHELVGDLLYETIDRITEKTLGQSWQRAYRKILGNYPIEVDK